MLEGLGFTVLRQIPLEYVTGIAKGIYSAHGGVIRDHAGRIVAHLALPVASSSIGTIPGVGTVGQVMQTYQLHALSESVQQVLAVSLANTALSGLGLVTTLAGVVYLSQKLSRIEAQIAEIKGWLQSTSDGQLRAAIADLKHAARTTDPDTRRQLLGASKSSFTSLAHHYRTQAASAKSPKVAGVYEEFSVTAALGAVMATSELIGLEDAAGEDFLSFRNEWASMARGQVRNLLELENSARLLDGRYAEKLPAAELVRLLDFANEEERGISWLDGLRRGYGTATALTSSWRPISDEGIEFSRRLRARHDVLSSFDEHFRFLRARRLSVATFAQEMGQLTEDGRLAFVIPAQVRSPSIN